MHYIFKIPLCLLVVICSVPLFSCKNNKSKSSLEKLKEASLDQNANVGSLNFIVQLPPNWGRIDTAIQGFKATILLPAHATDNFKPRVNISNAFMRGETHEVYISNTKQYLADNEEGIALLEDGIFKVQEYECRWYSYNKTQNGVKRQLVFYSIDIDGISYNITGGVFDGGLPQYKPLFDSIVKSFRLIN